MKTELDTLMQQRSLDGLLVSGGTHENPCMYYLANGAKVGASTLAIKQRGHEPVLIVVGMERDEAAKSGLQVVDRAKYKPSELLAAEGGDALRAHARLVQALCADFGLSGSVGVYGRAEQGHTLALFADLAQRMPAIRFVGETTPTVFDRAQRTKSAAEMARIRRAAAAAISVIGQTRDFLASHRARAGVLVTAAGSPLTIGAVKREIRRWTFELELEDPEGVIFAIGRDAAVPHSHGEDAQPIELGRTIVFDYFPREAGGGYFYDFTRTWCVGHAPPEVERVHAEVHAAFDIAINSMFVGQACREPQRLVNEYFEKLGHPTSHSHPGTTNGYLHGLGHSLGLSVHEAIRLADVPGNDDKLEAGMVLTVEPGLYYPERGFGVRIEDFIYMNPDTGRPETIGEFDKQLVIPVRAG